MKTSPWAVVFWYIVVDLLQEDIYFLAALVEAWTDSRFNRAENILSTLIVPGLDNGDNEMEKLEVDHVEEDQASFLEKPKFDEVEQDEASVPSKKQKNNKDNASITSTKKRHSWQSRKIKVKCG